MVVPVAVIVAAVKHHPGKKKLAASYHGNQRWFKIAVTHIYASEIPNKCAR
jgi:hypothetical protein